MFSTIVNRISEYIQVKGQQIKLEVMGRVARLVGHVIVVGFLAMLGLFLVFFLSFALSAFLNEALDSLYAGHLIVAGVYFLSFLIIALLAKTGRIQNWIEALILKAIDQMEEDE